MNKKLGVCVAEIGEHVVTDVKEEDKKITWIFALKLNYYRGF